MFLDTMFLAGREGRHRATVAVAARSRRGAV
jgi:hypothetical protein